MSAMDLVTEALVEPRGDGGWIVRAPRVGIYRGCPPEGRRRTPCESVGVIMVLNHRMELVLPAGAEGIVTDLQVNDHAVPVEYGQVLFALAPIVTMATTAMPGMAGAGGTGLPRPIEDSIGRSGQPALSSHPVPPLPGGCFAVTCPIDGIFYRSPSPTSAPFVNAGDTVESGRTLGLIEAMKSFNAVTYGGPGLPPRATIAEVCAPDASEVKQGARLFLVRSAGS